MLRLISSFVSDEKKFTGPTAIIEKSQSTDLLESGYRVTCFSKDRPYQFGCSIPWKLGLVRSPIMLMCLSMPLRGGIWTRSTAMC